MLKNTLGIITLLALVLAICHASRAHAEEKSIVLAGGCFWGMEGVFEHVKGVKDVVSGYSGGDAETAHYEMTGSGTTGHAESVKVTFNPQEVSLSQLLDVYFKVAHNPTQLNYQRPDEGTQYRSEIFYADVAQQKAVTQKIAELTTAKTYSDPIVTKVEALKAFYPAEDYHQNFMRLHPNHGYILAHDAPKVAKLKQTFPELYKEP